MVQRKGTRSESQRLMRDRTGRKKYSTPARPPAGAASAARRAMPAGGEAGVPEVGWVLRQARRGSAGGCDVEATRAGMARLAGPDYILFLFAMSSPPLHHS